MAKDTFILYKSFWKPLSKLTDEQLGKLFRAVFLYQLGEPYSLDDDIDMAFSFLLNQFELDNAKYEARCEKMKENITKRWQGIQKNTNDTKVYEPYESIHNDNDNDNVNVNDSIKENTKRKRPSRISLDFITDLNWRSLVQTWVDYKKEIKDGYKTQRGIETFVKNLIQYSGGDIDLAKRIIDKSIASEYKGIFEPKDVKKDIYSEYAISNILMK